MLQRESASFWRENVIAVVTTGFRIVVINVKSVVVVVVVFAVKSLL